MMTTCPACGAQQQGTKMTCQRCQVDLSLLVHLNQQDAYYYNEGLRLAKSGQPAAAREHLQTALGLNPQHLEAWIVLGKLSAQEGDYEEALSCWRKVMVQAPSDSPLKAKAEQGIAKVEEIQREQRRQAAQDRRRRRGLMAGAGLALFLLGLTTTLVAGKIRLAPEPPDRLASTWQQTVAKYPALRQIPVTGTVQNGKLVISGEVPSALHRELIVAIGQTFPADALDLSGVWVRPVAEAEALERLLGALPGLLATMGPGWEPWLSQAWAKTQVHVTATTDNRLALQGTVPQREIRRLMEEMAVMLTGRERVDLSGIQGGTDYLFYQVQAGDYPRGLAQRFLGNAGRWEELRQLTPENQQILKDPRRLPVGAVLRVPAPGAAGGKP